MNPGAAAEAWAATLIDGRPWDAAAAAAAGLDAEAVAWALKARCVNDWTRDPAQAAAAAQALRRLSPAGVPPGERPRAEPAASAPPAALDPATNAATGASTQAPTDAAHAHPTAPADAPLGAIPPLADWCDGLVALAQGEMPRAEAALQAAIAGWQARQRPLQAAQTAVALVMALAMQGRHDEAAACGEGAQAALQAGGDLAAAGKARLNLGSLYLRRDDVAAAAAHYRAAAVLFARVGDHRHSVLADIGLGDALSLSGELDAAAAMLARARQRAGHHALPLLQALADESMALLDLARGAYDRALGGLESARRAYAALDLPQHGAIAEKQLADAYLELRLLPEALALYQQALARMQALAMPDDAAWAQLQCGRTLALLGRPQAAAAALAAAAAHFAGPDSVSGAAAVALAQAELALAGADAPAAIGAAQAARQAYRQAGQPEGAARALALQAAARLQAGQAQAARADYRRLLDEARALQLLSLQLHGRAGLGLAALALGDEALAQRALQSAVAQFARQQQALPADELRGAWQAAHPAPWQGLLALALARHARQPGPEAALQVLAWVDAGHARALGLSLDGAAPALAEDAGTRALRSRLNWLHRHAQRLADEGTPSPRVLQRLHQTEQQLLEHARRLRLAPARDRDDLADPAAHAAHADAEADVHADADADAAAGADFDAAGLGLWDADRLRALQARLAPGDALVVYGRQGDEWLALVLRRDALTLHRALADAPALAAARAALRFQLDALRHGSQAIRSHLPELTRRTRVRLAQLHALLWAPLAPALQGAQRLLVVPAPGLADIPFAALGPADGPPLAAQHQLAQAPSLRLAARALARPARPPQRVLAVGEDSRLPHAAAEARAVAAAHPGGCALVGAQATLAALLARAPQADLLHLACHARFRADNPRFSALQLADGPLPAEQIEGLRLPAGTVVLSACETGLAGEQGGDEQFGLVRAFWLAGAARVLASLWPVDDAATAAFMAPFHAALRAGCSPGLALAQAQRHCMAAQPHPVFWAGFVLHGAW